MSNLIIDDQAIMEILARTCNIAVVGCSRDPSRPSRRIAQYLKDHGYRVFPVNPRMTGETLLGEPVQPSLLDIAEPIDLVNVFRHPEDVLAIAKDAVRIHAPVFWMQVGIDNEEARALLTAVGCKVIADRCIMVDHGRLSTAA